MGRLLGICMITIASAGFAACSGSSSNYVVTAGSPSDREVARESVDQCTNLPGIEEAVAGGESSPSVNWEVLVEGEDEAEAVASCFRRATYEPVEVEAQ